MRVMTVVTNNDGEVNKHSSIQSQTDQQKGRQMKY